MKLLTVRLAEASVASLPARASGSMLAGFMAVAAFNMTKHWATPAHCRCGAIDFVTAQCTLSDIGRAAEEGIIVRE